MVELYFGAEGDNVTKKQAASGDCLCCEAEYTNEGDEFAFSGLVSPRPAVQFSHDF